MRRMPDKKLTPEQIAANQDALRFLPLWLNFRERSQRWLAEQLGVSEPTVSKWLSGHQQMTVSRLSQIAALLEAAPEDLLFPPLKHGRGAKYKRIADLADNMPDEALDRWLSLGEMLTSPNK